jgi:hypothetical protein
MASLQDALFAATGDALSARLRGISQAIPGQYRVPISVGWTAALALNTAMRSAPPTVKPVVLVFSAQIQQLMDSVLGRASHPNTATLMFGLSSASSLLATSEPIPPEPWQFSAATVGHTADRLAKAFALVGLPAARLLGSVPALVQAHRAGGLGPYCVPVDFVNAAALALAGEHEELQEFVAERLASLRQLTTDAQLEPFLEFGPELLRSRLH